MAQTGLVVYLCTSFGLPSLSWLGFQWANIGSQLLDFCEHESLATEFSSAYLLTQKLSNM